MRDQILQEIEPFDELEHTHKEKTISWILSGADLFRLKKPATPPRHLVSYVVVLSANHILLVDHRKAQLWLPAGGHVEPDEHPRDAAIREAKEELGIDAEFMSPHPLFITCTETVGSSLPHTDVSLWYLLKSEITHPQCFDAEEFCDISWFSYADVPLERSDVHMGRFLKKLQLFLMAAPLANRNDIDFLWKSVTPIRS